MKIQCKSVDGQLDAEVSITFYGPKNADGIIPTIGLSFRTDIATAKSLETITEVDLRNLINDIFDNTRDLGSAPALNPDGTEVTPDPNYTEDAEYAALTS